MSGNKIEIFFSYVISILYFSFKFTYNKYITCKLIYSVCIPIEMFYYVLFVQLHLSREFIDLHVIMCPRILKMQNLNNNNKTFALYIKCYDHKF